MNLNEEHIFLSGLVQISKLKKKTVNNICTHNSSLNIKRNSVQTNFATKISLLTANDIYGLDHLTSCYLIFFTLILAYHITLNTFQTNNNHQDKFRKEMFRIAK